MKSMVSEPKIYELDDVLNGFNDFHKLKNLYSDLRDNVIGQNPIQECNANIITLNSNGHRGGQYGWELYAIDASLLMLEYFGSWKGYGTRRWAPPVKEANLDKVRLTIHNSCEELELAIEEVIAKYPRESVQNVEGAAL